MTIAESDEFVKRAARNAGLPDDPVPGWSAGDITWMWFRAGLRVTLTLEPDCNRCQSFRVTAQELPRGQTTLVAVGMGMPPQKALTRALREAWGTV